jgi:hypothetical protein
VEDLPDDSAKFVGNGPDGSVVAQLGHPSTKRDLEMRALRFDGRLGCLGQYVTEESIAFRRAGAMILFGSHLTAWTRADPGGKLAG